MSFANEELMREIVRDPSSAEIAHFLSTRTGAQMVQLVQAIREPVAQAALTTALLFAPPAVVGRSTTTEKAKKALNAFVGFRCYYISIPIFKPWPMKMLSNPMGVMWETDPNKPLWSLMAKAWSTIRDQIGKDNAPLDRFFAIICPFLGIPSQETYLELHGWVLTTDKDGVPLLSRNAGFQPASIRAGFKHLTLSVEDIINYCQTMGYAQEYVTDPKATSPTFLTQSHAEVPGQIAQAKVVSKTPDAIHDSRLEARNKRRVKRQSTKKARIIHALQVDMLTAHKKDAELKGEELLNAHIIDPVEFYGTISGIFTGRTTTEEDLMLAAEESAMMVEPNQSIIPPAIDWNAFRDGADEHATLPIFNDASL